jgi:hypothetical protein
MGSNWTLGKRGANRFEGLLWHLSADFSVMRAKEFNF